MRSVPRDLRLDAYVDVGQAGGGPDHLGDPLVVEVRQRLRLWVVAGSEDPAFARIVVGHQDRERPRLLEVGDAHGAAAQGSVQVCLDDRGHGGEQGARPVRLDPQCLPHRAFEPVSRHEIVRDDDLDLARRAVRQRGGDRLVVLAEGGELGVEP